jgi:hypothetical protein
MTRRLLTDFHHHGLAESLLLLFADRLGWDVCFPVGMEWFTEGVWQFERKWHGDAVARQYLAGIWSESVGSEGDIILRHDPRHPGRIHRGVTLAAARDMHWDAIVSSLPDNDPGFHRLAKDTGALFGVQVGNNLQQSSWALADFILSSSTLPEQGLVDPSTWARPVMAYGRPAVIYHQEFDLGLFQFRYPPAERHTVASFVNCFPEGPSYPEFLSFARGYPEVADFKVYGATGQPTWGEPGYTDEYQAGDIHSTPLVADAMRAARVVWHSKHWSDGFGHVIHNAFAVGRPVVGYQRYYADKLAGPLWVEGVTSHDIEGMPHPLLAALLIGLRDDDELHWRMSAAAADRFRELVNFEHEAEVINAMVEGLL